MKYSYSGRARARKQLTRAQVMLLVEANTTVDPIDVAVTLGRSVTKSVQTKQTSMPLWQKS